MVSPRLNKSLTLFELIIAIALLSLVVLNIVSIDLFSRYHLLDAVRRSKLQSELTYALEHMSKNIMQGTGNILQPGNPPLAPIANGFRVRVDRNTPPTPPGLADDTLINYTLSGNTLFCSLNAQTLSTSIVGGVAYIQMPANPFSGFYINLSNGNTCAEIGLVARYNPAIAESVDNPQVEMRTLVCARSASAR